MIWWSGSSNVDALGNAEYSFIVLAPKKILSMGQIELFDIYTECNQMTYAKLNCLK